MWCPKCANDKTKVIGSYTANDEVIRFRICSFCEFSFLSFEILKNDFIKRFHNGS